MSTTNYDYTYSACPAQTDKGQGGLRKVCCIGARILRVGQCLGSRTWRCMVLLAVIVTAALLFGALFMDGLEIFTATRPAWMASKNYSCAPRSNIAFLKSHKCASSSIQNILFRYGEKHNLHFALPETGNYFGGGLWNFEAEMVRSSPFNSLEPNIFAIHTKWDHDEVRKVMPEDTFYFTIVREPTALFQSLFVFYGFKAVIGLTMEQYVTEKAVDERYGYIGYNQMAWDFGMPQKSLNNLTAVREKVARAEDQFALVLVAERMEESLVLLAEYLCWELSDVLVLRLNSLRDEFKESLSPATRQLLQKKLAPDYVVYRHFATRFQRQVEAFGQQRMAAAVARLRELKAQLMDKCSFVSEKATKLNALDRPWSDKVDGFVGAGGDECRSYFLPELRYIERLRKKQMKEIKKWF